MKRTIIFGIATGIALAGSAQALSISDNTLTYYFPASVESMPFGDGNTLTIGNKIFSLPVFSTLNVSDEIPVDVNTVKVTYDGDKASVDIHGSVAEYVDIEVSGAHVKISQSDLVSESTCGEIIYQLSGQSDNGSLTLSGSYKSSIDLYGLTLTNPTGAAIDIQNGKRIAISAKNGTVNTLTDGSGNQKAALYCKGHLEFKGKGSLTVKGNQAHAISAKEYITVKNITLTVTGAVKDGINCNQYFAMESGKLTISGTGDDGIQASFKDDVDREAEDTGSVTVSGGTIEITVSDGQASKGIKADANIDITGGDLTILSNCNGIWDNTKLKTKASACLGADGDITIAGGTLNLTATGSGGKGISCDGVFTSNGGEMTISTTGGMLVYSNGTLNHNYTSSADRIASDYKSSAKGIKADNGVVINDGKINVYTSTNNAEGIESKTTLEINGGEIFIKAYDDGINSSGDLRITDGKVTVIAVTGDGIDSNANLYISGGQVITLGSGGSEQGLDAADESGCAAYITGGNVLSFGGRNAPVSKGTGSQAIVTVSGSLTANSTVSIKSGNDLLVSFEIPAEYTSSTSGPNFGPGNGPGGGGWNPGGGSGSGKLLLSCPSLVSGSRYSIVNGSSTSTATATYTSSSF